ncbi:hypothetical protein [Sphingomonas carotinifaciens]|uniref:Uncharacterized protein n=1 Tax=Sphingomonas carotinifaciens TaxID=1166323 RepID=A0A1G7M5E7_9SPHN|nr:hypothetical protein [Sphingomonas carotinifaciens]MBB4088078.1 hypothetical protein [Sphingomonas carotinifaciens]MWC45013.1 hypothetical protein [Sphingomonas carotinifaciens]SDF56816.1 hypothetical protein SAMN05216557_10473 [Sphingomonas carotinifaciens]
MASRDVAVAHLRKALSILDAESSDVTACHVQLAIDLILGPRSGTLDTGSLTAVATSAAA